MRRKKKEGEGKKDREETEAAEKGDSNDGGVAEEDGTQRSERLARAVL